MPRVTPKHPGERFESMYRRFCKVVDKAEVMSDFQRHEFYEKPSQTNKRRRAAAVKRAQREQIERNKPMIFDSEE